MLYITNSFSTLKNRNKRWSLQKTEKFISVSNLLRESFFPVYNNFIYTKSYVQPICLFSGSTKHVYSKFKLSRHFLRQNCLDGLLFGIKKSLW